MRQVELIDRTAAADGWHDVRSPGGYEWWYFDAQDPRTDTQVVAIFMEGFIFHPGYLRQHKAWRRKPTKGPPPTAGDFPCAYLCVYRGGKIWKQFFTQFPASAFHASSRSADVSIGDVNTIRPADGSLVLSLSGHPWNLSMRGPVTHRDQALSASLTFSPASRTDPIERRFLSADMTGAEHQWVLVHPKCAVSGSITLSGPGVGEQIDFDGTGYHDHNYGLAPIGDGLRRWMWGRAVCGDRVVTFHHAEPSDRSGPCESHLIECTSSGANDIAAAGRLDWSLRCRPAMMLSYPAVAEFTGESGEVLSLSNPRVIDPAPFYMRLTYDAVSRGERGTALCEIAYPHRIRWPVLGRMVEMSFDKRK
jgi:carotenoid 1,2-hydratase